MLICIKIAHTLIWAALATCILALPIAGLRRRFRGAGALLGVVLLECLVLAFNHGRCPLTDMAERYTLDRNDNFDIYLPLWLARYNKEIFGTLFVLGTIVAFSSWLFARDRR